MSTVSSARYSLPFIILEAVVIGLVVGAWMFTITDPLAQSLFASPSWSATTQSGSDLLSWLKLAWKYLPIWVLFGIMFQVWVYSRRGGP